MSWQRTGSTIFDRYVLGAQIGIGGMSEVYRAVDMLRSRTAAAKLVAPAFMTDPRALEMARREAWVIRQMSHPTVPVLYDSGDATLNDGTVVPCTVMELLNGIMLTERLVQGPLPWTEAVKIAATIADALAVAHRRGIVHRDLTSENLMLTPDGIKIIDFGLAGIIDGNDDWLSRSDRRMAARGWSEDLAHPGDPTDDVYSLGVLLYQMLTGRSPYPEMGDGMNPFAARLRRVAPTPVLAVPGLPRAVGDICRGCMAKRPADRPDSVTVALALWSMLVPGSPHSVSGPY